MTTTTLNEARSAVIKLADQFPVPSTYADLMAKIADYLDNQIPLKVENDSLMQRIAVLESAIDKIRGALPSEAATVTVALPTGHVINSKRTERRPIECTAWMGPGCKCSVCAGMISNA